MMLKSVNMIRFSSASNLVAAYILLTSMVCFVRSMKVTVVASFSWHRFSSLLVRASCVSAIIVFKVSLNKMLIQYLVEKQLVATTSYGGMVRGRGEMGREGMARSAGDEGRGLYGHWEMEREGMDSSFGLLVRPWSAELLLAYQSLGVVYGDVATAPLYVFKSAFAGGDIEHSAGNEEIYGVLSLVFWTLTLIPLIKYVFLVLRADDHGEGGTFALYSLICRRVRAGLLPGGGSELAVQPREDAALRLSRVRAALERHRSCRGCCSCSPSSGPAWSSATACSPLPSP
ncbi:hypothetical protein QYE76_030608 [Lolium multiflorum]|uniref:K+ potassium transporter integral membrane domain-containing protein n=1 Tax=Lolium multiflorum TaxID=4521 RepID=A0AAD8VJE6_LOLMU|nr:hypothetical protein QYE76_030608 [Lolium multiflorum]